MADDEEGFTFVDKRRAQAETPPAAQAAPAAEAAPAVHFPQAEAPAASFLDELDADLNDDDLGEGEAPSIYGILGYCVSLLAAEAWQKLGLLADPQTGQAQPDLAQAKVAIDAVGDLAARLQAAPPEAVPDSLQRDLRTLLNDLRLNYVGQQGQ